MGPVEGCAATVASAVEVGADAGAGAWADASADACAGEGVALLAWKGGGVWLGEVGTARLFSC